MPGRKLEICVTSVTSAHEARAAGADRIELCDNFWEGGTTPGHGMIHDCTRALDIPVHVLIRPRGGDFFYTDDEFDVMLADIRHAKELGVQGIVSGILTDDGEVDIERTLKLIEYSRPLSFTFHRAFDFVPNPFEVLEKIIELGAERILSSGQQATALEGAELLKDLNKKAGNRIIIMPGSGINSKNINKLIAQTACIEFHASARKIEHSKFVKGEKQFSLSNSPRMAGDGNLSIDKEVRKLQEELSK